MSLALAVKAIKVFFKASTSAAIHFNEAVGVLLQCILSETPNLFFATVEYVLALPAVTPFHFTLPRVQQLIFAIVVLFEIVLMLTCAIKPTFFRVLAVAAHLIELSGTSFIRIDFMVLEHCRERALDSVCEGGLCLIQTVAFAGGGCGSRRDTCYCDDKVGYWMGHSHRCAEG